MSATLPRSRAAVLALIAMLPRARVAALALIAAVVAALASATAVHAEEGTSIGGTVESTLGLSVGEPSAFTHFAAARRGRVFTAFIPIEVTATEGPTWLSVADGEAFAGRRRGRLVKGTSTLAIPLRAAAGNGPYRSLDATVDPVLEEWGEPVSLEAATIRLRQTVRGRAPRTLHGFHKLLLVTITAAGP
jgi:hypothetical protein